MNERSWADGRLDKWHQVLVVTTINALNAYSSKSFGLQHFHRNGNQDLGCVAPAASGADRVYTVGKCQIGFIDLNLPMKQFSVRANHCTT